MFLGIGALIIACKTLSFAGMSMILLWTLISNLSKVELPLPHGLFLVVTLSLFVGKGIGPRITTPDCKAISFIELQIAFKVSMSALLNFILTFAMLNSLKVDF